MNERTRRFLYHLTRPVMRFVLRRLPIEDPWERTQMQVPLRNFGSGARHDFTWYFEGESAVGVASIADVRDWLLDCEYTSDRHLFHEEDYWQHPRTFEQLRRGDCEDHALWAWRKLIELGVDADLVTGKSLPWHPSDPDSQKGHAWVMFRHEGSVFVLEATAKSSDRMIRPFEEARGEYRPEFGVDRTRVRYVFNGYLMTQRDTEFPPVRESSRRTA
jgi:hypothetical protein